MCTCIPLMRIHWSLFTEAASEWSDHNAPRLGAALAYYTVLSLAPSLVVVVAICGLLFGEQAVRGQVYWQVRTLIGDQGAAAVQTLLQDAHRPKAGLVASTLGFITLLLGASAVFNELRDTLNYIWDVPVLPGFSIRGIIRYRFLSFAIVLGIGFLMLVSLAFSAMIQAAGAFAAPWVHLPVALLETANFMLTFLATAFLFALMYRVIPAARVEWREVIIGSLLTAALFSVGKLAIGVYIGRAGVGSAYGAAGSLVVLLVWVYYSAQIFLYGAEVTHVFSKRTRAAASPGAQTSPSPASSGR